MYKFFSFFEKIYQKGQPQVCVVSSILNPSVDHLEPTPDPVSCRSPHRLAHFLQGQVYPLRQLINCPMISHTETQKADSTSKMPMIVAYQTLTPIHKHILQCSGGRDLRKFYTESLWYHYGIRVWCFSLVVPWITSKTANRSTLIPRRCLATTHTADQMPHRLYIQLRHTW